jgi:hypothetical protein
LKWIAVGLDYVVKKNDGITDHAFKPLPIDIGSIRKGRQVD